MIPNPESQARDIGKFVKRIPHRGDQEQLLVAEGAFEVTALIIDINCGVEPSTECHCSWNAVLEANPPTRGEDPCFTNATGVVVNRFKAYPALIARAATEQDVLGTPGTYPLTKGDLIIVENQYDVRMLQSLNAANPYPEEPDFTLWGVTRAVIASVCKKHYVQVCQGTFGVQESRADERHLVHHYNGRSVLENQKVVLIQCSLVQ